MGEGKHHADYTSYSNDGGKEEILQSVVDSYEALSYDTRNWVANLANCSSLLWHAYHSMKINVNWSGFYVLNEPRTDELILGPFQGKVACQIIKFGKGVCGNAASSAKTQLVPNVNEYPGHIACDGETQSEIVVPIVNKGQVVGVLDIDCLTLEGFDDIDVKYLEQLATLIGNTCDW
ncbi:DEHA2E19514p [Debaryomyces hansenii CBS767]|jgi:L-methionine (R)-S-oxide reductase|uniref:DEHA2E19514p n=1 Tax=Debaryomyces hansenii (strain ATCC 36239 / CBS 767 / BCRC 21394 / JCM 1990 / NBRC 0083 / IGC 2968) TaxID=284592 RepID=Q6BNR6_DEBHA|nr:DEHA2E19514p [Debaryomyces hansenii CBS767]CAG88427.1 DEHA2E19514p [Debaryomyces hansenii CBS767]|eukprot:XP_460154.1 DEHA2E19514p [Debaryomyces hansenii CBS767]